MITTLLFDVDGVLAIGEPWDKDLASTYGITREMTTPFFQGPFQACLVGKADLKEVLAAYLPRWGWSLPVEAFVDYWFCRYELDMQLLATVQQLREHGIKCYLATQQERYRTAYLLGEMGFAPRFDGMFSSAEIGSMKSEPRFFTSILDALDGCQTSDVLFWDDTPANVVTAQRVGIQAEVYRSFPHFLAKTRELTGVALVAQAETAGERQSH